MLSTQQNITKLFFTAFIAAFFILSAVPAHAATVFGPDGAKVDNATEYNSGTIDASMYTNLLLSFDFNVQKLEAGESATYGWRSGGSDTDLGTIFGATGETLDEIGSVSIGLVGGEVADLELYVKVDAGSSGTYDYADITNLVLSGDPAGPVDSDNDGIIEGDYCPDTTADLSGSEKLNPNRWRYDGTLWIKGLSGGGQGNSSVYTMSDTKGCSCDQIIDIFQSYTGYDYDGHSKFGCSSGLLEDFLELIWE